MELDTAVSYLVALAVPFWLVAEQAACWLRSPKPGGKQVEEGRLTRAPAPGTPRPAARVPAMSMARPRKIA